jgi:hypothetical protein
VELVVLLVTLTRSVVRESTVKITSNGEISSKLIWILGTADFMEEEEGAPAPVAAQTSSGEGVVATLDVGEMIIGRGVVLPRLGGTMLLR